MQDPQYRTTVAAMLAQQTADVNQPSQFIITTFHPQIIQQADKVYGVSHTNRISNIDVVTQARVYRSLLEGNDQTWSCKCLCQASFAGALVL
jgi:hypothetical protein